MNSGPFKNNNMGGRDTFYGRNSASHSDAGGGGAEVMGGEV